MKKALLKVAEELNVVLGVDPPIPTKGILTKDLMKLIMQASRFIDQNADEISDETIELLKELHCWPPKPYNPYPENGCTKSHYHE